MKHSLMLLALVAAVVAPRLGAQMMPAQSAAASAAFWRAQASVAAGSSLVEDSVGAWIAANAPDCTVKPSVLARLGQLMAPKEIGPVACHLVMVGMSARLVALSWGQPSNVNRTVTAGGVEEQWVYDHYYGADVVSTSYVYLTEGIVSAIQE